MAAANQLPDDVLELLADFTPKQIQALKEVADQEASSWPSRRDVLKASAIAGGAGTAATVMSNEGVQQARAGASTSDSDGDVGTPNNRVDIFSDGVSVHDLNDALQATTSARIESLINNASSGDVIRITPGAYTDVGPLTLPVSDVTVIAYGAEIEIDPNGSYGSPARWIDFNGQDEIHFYGGYWNANPDNTDDRNNGVAAYGFANSGGTASHCRIQDVTSTGHSSFNFRPRNLADSHLVNNHAICDGGTTGHCILLCTDTVAEGLSTEDYGDTHILADRNTRVTVQGGQAHALSTGSTHGIDSASNTDCRFEGITIDGNGSSTDIVNIRDDTAGNPNTGCVYDVTGKDASYGLITRSGSAHEIEDRSYYHDVNVGMKTDSVGATIRTSATYKNTTDDGIQATDGTVIVDGAIIDSPGDFGFVSGKPDSRINAIMIRNPVGASSPGLSIGTGIRVDRLSPAPTVRGTTDASGQITLDFSSMMRSEDKPVLDVQLEAAGEWYVDSWGTASNGWYNSATIQVTDSSGTAVGSGVSVVAAIAGV